MLFFLFTNLSYLFLCVSALAEPHLLLGPGVWSRLSPPATDFLSLFLHYEETVACLELESVY